MIEQRLKGATGEITIDQLVGSKVKVNSLSIRNGFNWNHVGNEIFTISSTSFRITLDGKCHTIINLLEIPDRSFTLKDITIININENEDC